MAPSRGFRILRTWRMLQCSQISIPRHSGLTLCSTAAARSDFSSFTKQLTDTANKLQSYVSSSSNPYLNLAIEDYIMRKSPADSTVLFVYVNRPCVVIGRNQNPWTEVNLGLLTAARSRPSSGSENQDFGPVDLVRRRSGGGTVFHDQGNLNWSITCPRGDFARDTHAEMTVRALRRLGVSRARVNERHDIVLDQGYEERASDPADTHRTPYTVDEHVLPRPLKVSGSAYKLTRHRALHHATTLLNSPNLHNIPHYLRSPAKALIQAKGVESVSSPVGNIGINLAVFQQQLQQQFAAMYVGIGQPSVTTVGEEYLSIPDIRKGYDELQTEDWMWSQTPQFDLLLDSSSDVGISMNVHHGFIKSLDFLNDLIARKTQEELRHVLVEKKLQDIGEWAPYLQHRLRRWDEPVAKIAKRLEEILPVPKLYNVRE